MKKQIRFAAALFGITLALTVSGCAGGSNTYSSIEEFRSDVEAAGIVCDNWFDLTATAPATEQASCNSSTVLVIYESGTDTAAEAQETIDYYLENEQTYGLVYGPNWLINVGADEAANIAAALGGEALIG